MPLDLQTRMASGGSVSRLSGNAYTLSLPPLPGGTYGLAQIDDYMQVPRSKFLHQPPLCLRLEARVSAPHLPGTWGFGFWNDPFSFGIGIGGMSRILPVLPNAAWFFYGSPENHLSLQDNLPGAGFQAMTLQSPRLPSVTSLLASPGLPFLALPASARFIRRLFRRVVKQAAVSIPVMVTGWHTYTLQWMQDRVHIWVDQTLVMETAVAPHGPLGLVIWIDNQFFRFGPDGKIRFGFLKTDLGGSLQIQNLRIDVL